MSLPNKYGWDRGSLAEPVDTAQECARRVRQADEAAAKNSVYGRLRATLSRGYPEWMYENTISRLGVR